MSSGQDQGRARFGPPIRQGGLVVRPAGNPVDVGRALALRGLAFRGDPAVDDTDRWDEHALHLLVEAAAGPDTGALWATMRLIPHPPGDLNGYAAGLYDLAALARAPGPALELGRLCLDPGQRNPDLLRLIWAGVARAAERWEAARLIGCTSFAGTDPDALAPALGLLALRHLGPSDMLPARRAPEVRALADFAPAATPEGAALLPPLLRAYLSLGGWVSDHLVIDRDLGTCHVFTCVEIAAMPEGRKRLLRGLSGQGHPQRD